MAPPQVTERVPDGSSVPAVVDGLLAEALAAAASDLHLEPGPDGVRVRCRIDGLFRDRPPLVSGLAEGIANRLKVMARLVVHRNDIIQEGQILFRADGARPAHELRISVMPVVHGEKIVIRFFDQTGRLRPLDQLGFGGPEMAGLESFLKARDGLFLVCGPSGSGKTTTIYALLAALIKARGERLNVVSLEDPVERVVPGVSQTRVNPDRGLDYAAGVKALLRQDPEVIAVAEIRDRETAEAVLGASFTGHLVLSSLHCGRASDAVRRLADLGLPVRMIATTLRGVLAQRLVRVHCRECHGTGCAGCDRTGFRGRTAFGEYLTCDSDPIRAMIGAGGSPAELDGAARAAGMRTLTESGRALVSEGLTRDAEIAAVVE